MKLPKNGKKIFVNLKLFQKKYCYMETILACSKNIVNVRIIVTVRTVNVKLDCIKAIKPSFFSRWISAFGICLAYLELIFLMGRYPFLGGSISLMFYSILKHLFKSLSNFFVLIVGFGFGFFIMHHSKKTEHFENPWKAVAKTLTMALGEFDFDNLYDAHGSDAYSRMFTMVLMVGLAVMGSLILVNLIVAIIVSDIGELRRQAHLQETINKAQHVVFIESILPSLPSWCLRKAKKSEEEEGNCVFICPHNMCR